MTADQYCKPEVGRGSREVDLARDLATRHDRLLNQDVLDDLRREGIRPRAENRVFARTAERLDPALVVVAKPRGVLDVEVVERRAPRDDRGSECGVGPVRPEPVAVFAERLQDRGVVIAGVDELRRRDGPAGPLPLPSLRPPTSRLVSCSISACSRPVTPRPICSAFGRADA